MQAMRLPGTCYLHVHGQDSITLDIAVDGDTVWGKLQFKNYQIDGSSGTVSGRFEGDTLLVKYDFFAEGTRNITEEAFLKQGDRYIRGFGDRKEVDGVYRFADKRAIDFVDGQVFRPVACNTP